MNRKKGLSTIMLLLLAFSALSVLRFDLARVSAVPVSPYIMVKPEKTLNSTYTVDKNYTVSIYTNYNISEGNDAYMYQFCLTFNSSILEGLEVRNGDLITTAKHPTIFLPGTFDNTIGILKLTSATFDHSTTKWTTTGPGILANVTFRVKGYGISDIHLSDTLDPRPAVLFGYNSAHVPKYYEIIDGFNDWGQLGHGFFSNKLIGDIDGDKDVDGLDLGKFGRSYGSLTGQPKYKRECDFDLDGDVDNIDLGMYPPNYGKSI
jgi:hypothetical protein